MFRVRISEIDQWCGGFPKWWYPTIMGFSTKNDHFGVFWGYHHFRKPHIDPRRPEYLLNRYFDLQIYTTNIFSGGSRGCLGVLRSCNRSWAIPMKLERSDDHCFVGLSTRWIHKSLVLCPNFNNSYNDSRTIKPWYSWAPKTQQNAVVFGLLCRAYQQCNVDFARSSAFIGAITVLLQAQYPMSEIALRACKWARTWKPFGSEDVPASNIVDIRHALSHTAHQSHSQWCKKWRLGRLNNFSWLNRDWQGTVPYWPCLTKDFFTPLRICLPLPLTGLYRKVP